VEPDRDAAWFSENAPWTHGSRLGREHQSLRMHLVEDHRADPGWAENASDAAVHGSHDGQHSRTWAYAYDLPHPVSLDELGIPGEADIPGL
jgi:hypothetical protein